MKGLVISHKKDNFSDMFTHAGNEDILVVEYNSTMIVSISIWYSI